MRPLDDAPNTGELLPDLLADTRARTDRAEVTDALDAIDGALTNNIRPLTGAAAVLAGIQVIESDLLPIYPTHRQDATRIVKHGLADVLEWLGEKVGPMPGEPTHMLMIGRDLHASAAMVGKFRDLA
jgi:hypothetical protein